MFAFKVSDLTELRLLERQHGEDLYKTVESNRKQLRRWARGLDGVRSVPDAEKAIAVWLQLYATNRGFQAGIWHQGQFCGMIGHLSLDWTNRWTSFSYWLDKEHQGKGIMTTCCRAFISHGFNTWKLNRITIECATDNKRSRAIPERLGFKLEAITRGCECVDGQFIDHAIYGLLRSDYTNGRPSDAAQPEAVSTASTVLLAV